MPLFRGPAIAASFSVLILCLGMTALGRGAGESYAVFLLPLSADLGWDRSSATSVYSIFMAATGFFAPLAGYLFDRYGGRLVYVAGLLALAAGYFAAGSLSELWHFQLAIGVFCGFGAALIGLAPAQAVVSRWFDKGLATALAMTYGGLGVGTLVMAPLAEYLIAEQGWRAAYGWYAAVFVVLGLFVLFLPWRRIAEGAEGNPRRHARGIEKSGPSLFAALKTGAFWVFFAIFFVTAMSIYGVSLQSVAYLVSEGMSERQAAFAFGTAGMLSFFGMTLTGMLADRFGHRIVATSSYGLTVIAIGALYMLPSDGTGILLVIYIACFGLSMGARGPIITTLMARRFSGSGIGAILGAANFGQGIGAGFGAFLSGVLFDLTGGYGLAFAVCTAAAILGAGLFWTVGAEKK
ncbi:MFS transporter [Nisaea acidiphila]|uniref:MFS transporter n=1 Tax=Nisaea acidiphila TaxID=1862145 RepID=A0A9J7AU04_9PROT|nr:MFS transporter [Nisaea acidiphila]UUX49969.1 MFS transporter [Nisaea acidiphila]